MNLKLLQLFGKFYWQSKTIYSAHSPYIYDFFNEVLDTSREYYCYQSIENCRKELERSKESISFIEYGAGSKYTGGNMRKVAQVAKSSLSKQWQCRRMKQQENITGPLES